MKKPKKIKLKPKRKTLSLDEHRKRNMLLACLKTPNCNPKLVVKKEKDSMSDNYVVTLNGIKPLLHSTDLKLIKSLKLDFERAVLRNSKLTLIFTSIVGYEEDE